MLIVLNQCYGPCPCDKRLGAGRPWFSLGQEVVLAWEWMLLAISQGQPPASHCKDSAKPKPVAMINISDKMHSAFQNCRRCLKASALNAVASIVIVMAAFAQPSVECGADDRGAKGETLRGDIVLARADHPWMSQQVQEPCVLPNPKDPERLIMFYSGVPSSNRGVCAIGKAWAKKSDPFNWHQDAANPIFRPAAHGWDATAVRLDAMLYIPEEDSYYVYYTGTDGGNGDRIGLAICPAGTDGYSDVTAGRIVRFRAAPVLTPQSEAPFQEHVVSQAAVMREWDAAGKRWNWFMYYSYRGKDGVLPGIRMATSHDGKTWTRHFNADDPRNMGQIFRSTPNAYYEWHQIQKIGATYVLCMEVGIDRGARWRPVLAVSTDPERGWTQMDVDTMLQLKWPGIYADKTIYHVATPAIYQINGRWYLFAQACGRPASGNYIDGRWEMWCFACDRRIPTRLGCADVYIPGAMAVGDKNSADR